MAVAARSSLLLLVLLSLASLAAPAAADTVFTFSGNTYGLYSDTKLTWAAAAEAAPVNNGKVGRLVIVGNNKLNARLAQELDSSGVTRAWIGANTRVQADRNLVNWYWRTAKSKFYPGGYANWVPGQPAVAFACPASAHGVAYMSDGAGQWTGVCSSAGDELAYFVQFGGGSGGGGGGSSSDSDGGSSLSASAVAGIVVALLFVLFFGYIFCHSSYSRVRRRRLEQHRREMRNATVNITLEEDISTANPTASNELPAYSAVDPGAGGGSMTSSSRSSSASSLPPPAPTPSEEAPPSYLEVAGAGDGDGSGSGSSSSDDDDASDSHA